MHVLVATQTNPLDAVTVTSHRYSIEYKYFLKVVPTIYVDLGKRSINTNQFSVTEHNTGADDSTVLSANLPGIFFYYDLSPIKVSNRCMCTDEEHLETNGLYQHTLTSRIGSVQGGED